MASAKIEAWQIKRIQGLKRTHDVDDKVYRELLRTEFNGAKSCTDLTSKDADRLISRLEGKQVPVPRSAAPAPTVKLATAKQIALMRYYALACAINFGEMGSYVVDDRELEGEDLRAWLVQRFNTNRIQPGGRIPAPPIPDSIVRDLYFNWINPKSNDFLVSGKFKRWVRIPEHCYYEQLSESAVQHLINKYRAIYQNVAIKPAEVQIPFSTTIN